MYDIKPCASYVIGGKQVAEFAFGHAVYAGKHYVDGGGKKTEKSGKQHRNDDGDNKRRLFKTQRGGKGKGVPIYIIKQHPRIEAVEQNFHRAKNHCGGHRSPCSESRGVT